MILRNRTSTPTDCAIAAGWPSFYTDDPGERQVFLAYVQRNMEHAKTCPQCNAIIKNFIAYANAQPVPAPAPRRGFLRGVIQDTLIGMGAQFAFHAAWAAKDLVFDQFINESRRMSAIPVPHPDLPPVNPDIERIRRDVARIRHSVTGSEKQWPMPGEDKTLV